MIRFRIAESCRSRFVSAYVAEKEGHNDGERVANSFG
jgi:hypothetical protein